MNSYEMPEVYRPTQADESVRKAYHELAALLPAQIEVSRTDWPQELTQQQKDCLHMAFYHIQQAMKGGSA